MSFYLLGLTGYDGRTFCAIRYRFKACSRYLIGRDLITDHYKRKVDTRTTALSFYGKASVKC
nr:MAG TPA: hypothetical protein [Caudoviricetes sp.]